MPPIIILDTSRVRLGRIEDVRRAFEELTRFVEANEPRTLIYNVYLDSERSLVTVLQVHPDSASAEFHMDVGASEFRKFVELLDLEAIHVYGDASSELLSRLDHKSDMLHGQGVLMHGLHAGFSRLADPQ